MEGIGFLIMVIAFALLLHWVITNDKAPNSKTTGVFALREPEERDQRKPQPPLPRKLPPLGQHPARPAAPPRARPGPAKE
jgi:hypothetical protein